MSEYGYWDDDHRDEHIRQETWERMDRDEHHELSVRDRLLERGGMGEQKPRKPVERKKAA